MSDSRAEHATSRMTAPSIRAILGQHAYRMTKPREQIIDLALRHDRPFTAEQLVTELGRDTATRDSGIGRATVYRTLEILASVDVLSRVMQPGGGAAYVVDAPGHRHHLVCSSCGATVSFRSCPVDTLIQNLTADTDYTIHGHLLEVFGTCPDCRVTA